MPTRQSGRPRSRPPSGPGTAWPRSASMSNSRATIASQSAATAGRPRYSPSRRRQPPSTSTSDPTARARPRSCTHGARQQAGAPAGAICIATRWRPAASPSSPAPAPRMRRRPPRPSGAQASLGHGCPTRTRHVCRGSTRAREREAVASLATPRGDPVPPVPQRRLHGRRARAPWAAAGPACPISGTRVP